MSKEIGIASALVRLNSLEGRVESLERENLDLKQRLKNFEAMLDQFHQKLEYVKDDCNW